MKKQLNTSPSKMSQNAKREGVRNNRKSLPQSSDQLRQKGVKVSESTTNIQKQQKIPSVMFSEITISETTSTSSNEKSQRKKVQTQTNVNNNKSQAVQERLEREKLLLWRRPVQTVRYATFEMLSLFRSSAQALLQQRVLLSAIIIVFTMLGVLCHIAGPHQVLLDVVRQNTWFFVYWIGLGVLSSVGLGTGLHTFILYLGPHIASVTLAAYECNSLNFPKPPYPDDIICPDEPYAKKIPNIWAIMSKVRLEAFLWGAGTALGELPPYFMARAARLSGQESDDAEELNEFKALQAKRNQENLGLVDRGKLFMERVVERIGFFGILVCASVPNPLFDLAGITCGHFLVPFWTFFGATLIGKAIIKMHLQKVFVIIAFNEALIERAVDLLEKVPLFGRKLQSPFKSFLHNQKQHLHRRKNARVAESGNLLSRVFEKFVIGMILYFIISIVNSLAQNYHKRIHKRQDKKKSKKRIVRKDI